MAVLALFFTRQIPTVAGRAVVQPRAARRPRAQSRYSSMTGTELGALVGALLWLADLAIKVIALGVIPRNRRPSTGMAWLLLILIIPFLGLLIFLLIGRTSPGRKRHQQQAEINEQVRARLGEVDEIGLQPA